MTVFGYRSESTSAARQRMEAAGRAFAARKEKAVVDADRAIAEAAEQRNAAKVERQRVATEEWMAREAQASAERFYDDPVTAPRPTMAQIVAEVSQRTGIAVNLILSHRREKRIVPVRHECFWLCREKTTHAYPTIARFFHRDHSTIMHGCRAHEQRMAQA